MSVSEMGESAEFIDLENSVQTQNKCFCFIIKYSSSSLNKRTLPDDSNDDDILRCLKIQPCDAYHEAMEIYVIMAMFMGVFYWNENSLKRFDAFPFTSPCMRR